jgi:hypothetical protein
MPITAEPKTDVAIHDFIEELPVSYAHLPGELTIQTPHDLSITTPLLSATINFHSESIAAARLEQMKSAAVAELERYARYRRGWDGYSGEPFARKLIDDSIRIIRVAAAFFAEAGVLPTELTTGPASDGSLDIEIRTESKRLILTLYPNSREVYVYREDDGNASEEVRSFSRPLLVEQLLWLVS